MAGGAPGFDAPASSAPRRFAPASPRPRCTARGRVDRIPAGYRPETLALTGARAAATMLAMAYEQPHGQVEVQLGHLCNNRCVFCVSGQLSAAYKARQIPAEPVIEELRRARRRGATKVTLLGGEPTIQRSFFEVLEAAVSLGFDEIVIFTNGVMTERAAFVDRVLALGDFTWRFSIQGATARHHDAVTRRKGSFERIVRGMAYLAERGQHITANMCITRANVESLPAYPDLVRRYGIAQLHLDQVRPMDAGERDDAYLRDIMPRYSDQRPYLEAMLEGFDDGFDVNVGNYPYCLMPAHAHRIHHDGAQTWTVAARTADLTEAFDKYAVKRQDKAHPAACEGCIFRPRCAGLFEKYRAFYGTGEVRAVTRDDLWRIDGGRHHLPLLLAPALEALRASPPPAPWKWDAFYPDEREGTVRIALRHGGAAGGLNVELLPPGRARRPHGRARGFDFVASGLGLDPLRGAAAVAWVLERVAAAAGVEVTEPVDVQALVRRGACERRAARAASKLARRVRERGGTHVEVLATQRGFEVHYRTDEGTQRLVVVPPSDPRQRPRVAPA